MLIDTNKIAFVNIYFGSKPKYFDLFIESAKLNSDFDFILFNDFNETINTNCNNIYTYPFTINEFNTIAINKGIIHRPIVNPYKLCDLKPAWFHILEDFKQFSSYEYIGYIDLDMILGKINNFIKIEDLRNYDIWTISDLFISGALSIFKNTYGLKRLYQKSSSWKIIFNHPDSFAFDEDFWDKSIKEKVIKEIKLSSFYDIVLKEENNVDENRRIKVCRNSDIVYEGSLDLFRYENFKFFSSTDKEYLAYNFIKAKKYFLWYFPKWEKLPNKFYINKYGIFKNKKLILTPLLLLFMPPYCFNSWNIIRKNNKKIIKHVFSRDIKNIKSLLKEYLG